MTKEEKRELMLKIKEEILNNKKLPLYKERKKNKVFPVIGEGSHSAKIMFIGEAPGKNEAATGRPFCGASGKFLDKLLAHTGIKREDVYITNIVKDRPPANRDPLPNEIESYAPYLDRQIDIIRPKIIATLGRFSMVYIMEKFGLKSQLGFISQIHGRSFEARAPFGKLVIIPLYHPAVAIYNPHAQEELKKDFLVLKKFPD